MESFLQSSLKDEVMKIMPVQKQTRAGQRTRFKVPSSLVQESYHWAVSSTRKSSWCLMVLLAP